MPLGLASLQGAYNANVAPPHVTLDGAGALVIAEPTATSGTSRPAFTVQRAAGNAVAGDGVGIYYGITSDNGTARIAAQVDVDWDDPRNGAEVSAYVVSVMNAGSLGEALRADPDGLTIPIGAAFYFGDKNTNGSWRIRVNGNDLVRERREAGVWIEKDASTAV